MPFARRTRADDLPERILAKLGGITDREIAAAYAEHFSLPLFAPEGSLPVPEEDFTQLLPEKLCSDQLIAPIAIRDDVLDVAFVTPQELLIIDEIQLLTGMTVRPLIAPLSVVEGLIESLFNNAPINHIREGQRGF